MVGLNAKIHSKIDIVEHSGLFFWEWILRNARYKVEEHFCGGYAAKIVFSSEHIAKVIFFCGIKKHASAPARLSSTKAAKTMNFASSACANAEEFGDDLEPISRGFMCALR